MTIHPAPTKALASLESGDRLSRTEFHRLFCQRPDIKKAELVQGVVYVPSPMRYGVHGEQQQMVVFWLSTYALAHEGTKCGFDATVFIGDDSELMPDAFLFVVPPPPGGARLRRDNYIEGAPQLVVEIAASTASYDLHDKLEAYRRGGVAEYIVWRVINKQLDWFRLRGEEYVRVSPDERGVIDSTSFPGLRLNVTKLLAGDMQGVLAELSPAAGA